MLFSIVMPTRNRAHLLRYALESALAQTFDDYEILVCDNDSRDDTPAVARAWEDPRVRYVRTAKTLAMPDNWEFALFHARGEHVTYLSDDDALHPRLLATLADLLRERLPEPIVWQHCRYRHATAQVEERTNTLIYAPFTGAVTEMESHPALKYLFGLRGFHHRVPKMMNCLCSRALIARVVEEAGRLFEHTSPDFSCCAALLALAPRYTFVDTPFWIVGESPDSIGRSNERSMDNPAGQAFMREFGDPSGWFAHTPLRQPSDANSVADTLLRVRAALPERLGGYQLDWARYFGDCYVRIQRTRHAGRDVSAYVEEFWRELARMPAGVQARVRLEVGGNELLTRLRGRPVEGLRDPWDLLKRTARAALGAAGVPAYRRTFLREVWGSDAGFATIAECAARLDAIFTERQALGAGGRRDGGAAVALAKAGE
jgi:hypothetical protein